MFPLGFFLVLVVASFNIQFKKSFYVIAAISLLYYILTLYYLSIQTTYNQAYNWVNENLADKKVMRIFFSSFTKPEPAFWVCSNANPFKLILKDRT